MGAEIASSWAFLDSFMQGPVSFGVAGWFMAKTFWAIFEKKDTQLIDTLQTTIKLLSEDSKKCHENYARLSQEFSEFKRSQG